MLGGLLNRLAPAALGVAEFDAKPPPNDGLGACEVGAGVDDPLVDGGGCAVADENMLLPPFPDGPDGGAGGWDEAAGTSAGGATPQIAADACRTYW